MRTISEIKFSYSPSITNHDCCEPAGIPGNFDRSVISVLNTAYISAVGIKSVQSQRSELAKAG